MSFIAGRRDRHDSLELTESPQEHRQRLARESARAQARLDLAACAATPCGMASLVNLLRSLGLGRALNEAQELPGYRQALICLADLREAAPALAARLLLNCFQLEETPLAEERDPDKPAIRQNPEPDLKQARNPG